MEFGHELGAVVMGGAACYAAYKALCNAGVRLPGRPKRRSQSRVRLRRVWRVLAKDFAAFAGGVMETLEGGDFNGDDGDADV